MKFVQVLILILKIDLAYFLLFNLLFMALFPMFEGWGGFFLFLLLIIGIVSLLIRSFLGTEVKDFGLSRKIIIMGLAVAILIVIEYSLLNKVFTSRNWLSMPG